MFFDAPRQGRRVPPFYKLREEPGVHGEEREERERRKRKTGKEIGEVL
jgi:hypothetical protein